MSRTLSVLLLSLLALPALANDLFIGTLTRQGNQLILIRCDLLKNRYILVDPDNTSRPALPALRDAGLAPGQVAYLEVFARYDQRNGQDYLVVDAIRALQQGRNCHLF